jgi:uroporphyrin-III C-methyltransferase
MNGAVWIVGAGPGDPELITRKGYALVHDADVIFYDALVDVELLRDVRAECVFVGKRRNFQAASQDEINERLAAAARDGKRVVRLKGGDPFVFGRGGEEVLYLLEQGIPCTVVPGVTAASAAAAAAQVPLTHRGMSASVRFVTGHRAGASTDNGRDGRAARTSTGETTVYYMAASTSGAAARAAIEDGADRSTPVALVWSATMDDETIATTTLGALADGKLAEQADAFPAPDAASRGLQDGGMPAGRRISAHLPPDGSPLIMIAGAVAALAQSAPQPTAAEEKA